MLAQEHHSPSHLEHHWNTSQELLQPLSLTLGAPLGYGQELLQPAAGHKQEVMVRIECVQTSNGWNLFLYNTYLEHNQNCIACYCFKRKEFCV